MQGDLDHTITHFTMTRFEQLGWPDLDALGMSSQIFSYVPTTFPYPLNSVP